MKLSPDGVRDILIFLEENIVFETNIETNTKEKTVFRRKQIADAVYNNKKSYSYDELIYAIETMIEENYLIPASKPVKDSKGNYIFLEINDISIKGHELLGNIHNDTVWKAIKKKAKSMGEFSLKTLSTTAFTVSTTLMTDPNAIDNFLNGVDNILKMF